VLFHSHVDAHVDIPVLIRVCREKMTEVVFEKFKPTGFFLAKESTLSSFASGRFASPLPSLVDDHGYRLLLSSFQIDLSRT